MGVIAAGVGLDPHLDARQPPVLPGADAVAHVVGMPLGRSIERFLPRVDQAHWLAQVIDRQGHRDRGRRVLFASKGAADGRRDEPHLRRLEGQRRGDVSLVPVRLVGRPRDRDPSLLVQVAQHRLALQRAVLQVLGAVAGLEDHVRAGKGALEVPVLDLKARQHVALLVDGIGVVAEGRLQVKGMRQDLVLDLDGLCAGLGPRCRSGHNQRHRCPHHFDRVPDGRQDRLVLAVAAQAILARDVGRREDPHHAGQLGGAADVQRDQARVGMGAAQHFGVQHARHRHILHVFRPTGHLVDGVLAPVVPSGHRLPAIYHLQLLAAHPGCSQFDGHQDPPVPRAAA